MVRQFGAPGAPGPPCVLMMRTDVSRLVCSVQVVRATVAGRSAETVPAGEADGGRGGERDGLE